MGQYTCLCISTCYGFSNHSVHGQLTCLTVLSFQATSVSHPSVSSFYSRTSTCGPNDVYVPESSERSDCVTVPVWQPGWSLAVAPQPLQQQDDVWALLQIMQHTIESNFSELKGNLSELDTRIIKVEENQKKCQLKGNLSELDTRIIKVEENQKKCQLQSTSSSSKDSPSCQRRRKNPAELQVHTTTTNYDLLFSYVLYIYNYIAPNQSDISLSVRKVQAR